MDGNGQPKPTITVAVERPAPGWALFHVKEATAGTDVSAFVHQTITTWLREHQQLRVRATLPIVTGGMTVAVHIWFDGAEVG